MIKGVIIKKLTIWPDDRGYLTEILRSDDKLLSKFGQTIFTLSYPGVIKAFHWHQFQDDLWFVSAGMAEVVLYDRRPRSKSKGETQVIFAGEQNPVLILIPRGVAHGYKVLGNKPCHLFYHTTKPYNPKNPDEKRIPYDDPEIGFDWNTKHR